MIYGTENHWNNSSADLSLTPNKRRRGRSFLTIRQHFYLKVVFNNHKSEVCQRNSFVIHSSNTVFPGMKIFFSYRNRKRSTPLFWTYIWHGFVNKNSSKLLRYLLSLLPVRRHSVESVVLRMDQVTGCLGTMHSYASAHWHCLWCWDELDGGTCPLTQTFLVFIDWLLFKLYSVISCIYQAYSKCSAEYIPLTWTRLHIFKIKKISLHFNFYFF